jgi:hypothetical protein
MSLSIGGVWSFDWLLRKILKKIQITRKKYSIRNTNRVIQKELCQIYVQWILLLIKFNCNSIYQKQSRLI